VAFLFGIFIAVFYAKEPIFLMQNKKSQCKCRLNQRVLHVSDQRNQIKCDLLWPVYWNGIAKNGADLAQQWRKVCFAFFAAQQLHIFCANKGTKKAHCF